MKTLVNQNLDQLSFGADSGFGSSRRQLLVLISNFFSELKLEPRTNPKIEEIGRENKEDIH